MEHLGWILWTVLGVALIVAEIFTLGFVLFWFGIGALVAAFFALLGFGVGVQFLSFAFVSIVLTILSRTIFSNLYSQTDANTLKTGVDSLPGQIGTVIGASKGTLNAGEVKVFGSTWTAFPEKGEEPLLEGEKVEVVEVKGASIYVRRVRELPEWREE
jgi:membrane protein implicated in regulation of membrane protease activity